MLSTPDQLLSEFPLGHISCSSVLSMRALLSDRVFLMEGDSSGGTGFACSASSSA